MIGRTKVKNSEYEKLLGFKVVTKLNFSEDLNDIISKNICKVNAISRLMPYMSSSMKKELLNQLLNPDFSYCHLAWMLHKSCFRL